MPDPNQPISVLFQHPNASLVTHCNPQVSAALDRQIKITETFEL